VRWYELAEGQVGVGHAWTASAVRREVEDALETLGPALPSPDTPVLIKPNLNNDLPALMGNATDLRVLQALLEALADRGHSDLTLADGSNVGIERRGIDSFRRLRVDRLARRHGVQLLDLNRAEGVELPLVHGVTRVARQVLEAPFLLAVPKLKTHAEAGLSLTMKGWVGAVVGQHKRDMHRDLPAHIARLSRQIRPHLILLDGLVGMEGNGPGDGRPFRMDLLVAGTDAPSVDLATARLVGMPWRQLPALVQAVEAGDLAADLPARVEATFPVRRPIDPAPPRNVLARAAEHKLLRPLKLAVRPVVDLPAVSGTAHRLGVIQDRYDRDDDQVDSFYRKEGLCNRCGKCAEVCPDTVPWEDIGSKERGRHCLVCLYCFWVCPTGAIALEGDLGYLRAQIGRYKKLVEGV
jgi:uncharacterized protein (DUF362 family)/ferredoxin